jgi:polyisoprenoid-binding protein YceI
MITPWTSVATSLPWSSVIASWVHLGFSNPIALFDEVDGALVYDEANVAASSVQVTIPVASVNGFSDAFLHLRGAELFDAAKFPTMAFQSTAVEAVGRASCVSAAT